MSSNTNTDILLAGAFAAFTIDLLVYPLDTLKTRIQSPEYGSRYGGRHASPRAAGRAALFRGLYQGVGSVIIATIPSSGAFFTTYEAVKHVLSPLQNPNSSTPFSIPTPVIHSFASGTAELVSCAILTPAEVIKQNAQVLSTGRSDTGVSGSSTTLKVLSRLRSHPTKLWSGYTALVMRNLPFTGLQFPMYEALKARMLNSSLGKGAIDDDCSQSTAELSSGRKEFLRHVGATALSAGIAGSIAATVTTPIDVVKTRIMLMAGDEGKREPTTLRAVGKRIYQQDGFSGLFRGGLLRAGWTALGLGLYLGSYEGARMLLEDRREQKRKKADETLHV